MRCRQRAFRTKSDPLLFRRSTSMPGYPYAGIRLAADQQNDRARQWFASGVLIEREALGRGNSCVGDFTLYADSFSDGFMLHCAR